MSKTIVIIGNGAGGSQTAAELQKSLKKNNKTHKIIVISALDYVEVSVSMTKILAAGTTEHESALYDAVREDGIEYIVDSCEKLANDHLMTSKGNKIPFDICIVATGQSYPIFMPKLTDTKKEDRISFINDLNKKIISSKNIVVSGGGAVGCEVAADIKLRYKDIK
mgnify:CR=1 FL=1